MQEPIALIRQLRGPSGTLVVGQDHDLDRSGEGKGFIRTWQCEKVLVTVADAEFQYPRRQRMEVLSDVLLLRAAGSGECRYAIDGGTTWHFLTPAVTVAAIPRGAVLEVEIAAGVRHQCMTVLAQPHGLLWPGEQTVPGPLRRLSESPVATAEQLLSMPMSPEILSLMYDLRHSKLVGELRSMQMASRATELMLLIAADWSERLRDSHRPGLLNRDADLLAAARHVLLERCTNPPTLIALARELGTNKNKLNRLFRDRFGTTPQSYALERRMERAQSLIADGRMTVGQVADAVGYQHQSSFTTAFRQALGVSPREYASRVATRAAH